MKESELLAHIALRSRGLAREFPAVLVGPGDDAAVVRVAGDLLLKVDQLIEGRHFRADAPIELIARKALARPISDIAAMGGEPVAALASACLPPGFTRAAKLFDAMHDHARAWRCPLVGGDIAQGAGERLSLSVSVVGRPHPRRGPVLRSGAREGDSLLVSGPLGGSLDPATGLGRHLTFEPRVALARELCDQLGDDLRSMIDLSDGLGIDAARLADSSGLRAVLDAASIPLAPGVASWRRACADGEDHELLIACGPSRAGTARSLGMVTVGRLARGGGCVVIEGGIEHDARALGFDPG